MQPPSPTALATTFLVGGRPTDAQLLAAVRRARPLQHNHPHPGGSRPPDGPLATAADLPGWTVIECAGAVGHGPAAYRAAAAAALDWRVLEHAGWAGIRADDAPPAGGEGGGGGGRTLCTYARCYGGLAWVVNPCRQAAR